MTAHRECQRYLATLLALSTLLAGCAGSPTSYPPGDTTSSTVPVQTQALRYLNRLRQRAGMPGFTAQTQLAVAATNHARYLEQNKVSGHIENAKHRAFTGVHPADRAAAAGYSSREVSENVSTRFGVSGPYDSIDGLMGAIYHRFGFLDLTKDQIGIGDANGSQDSFVYVMGNSGVGKLCAGREFSGTGKYYTHICINDDFRIPAGSYDQLIATLRHRNPAIVTWPADGDNDVPPAFFQEDPDPLPKADVSGYPVSVQFNPAVFSKPPRDVSLAVYSLTDGKKLRAITLMDRHNDPNHRFTDYQYALFPTERLEWKRRYRVELRYNDGQAHKRAWYFTTRDPGYPIHRLTTDNQTIDARPGTPFVVYLPPRSTIDTDSSLKSDPSTVRLQVDYIDANTVKMTATGSGTVTVTFHHRRFRIKV